MERNMRMRSGRAFRIGLGCLLVLGIAWLPGASQAASGTAAVRLLNPGAGKATIHLAQTQDEQDVPAVLTMERGKSVVVTTDYRVKRIAIGDPEILDGVVINPRELQLVPKKVGETNVVIWDAAGRPQAAIDVQVGTAYSAMQRELRRVLENEDITIDAAGESVVVKGSVSSQVAMERALRVARAFFPEKAEDHVINLLEVGGNQQVMIEIKIAELDRTLRRRLGTNFSSQWEGGGNQYELFSFLNNLTAADLIDPTGASGAIKLSDRINLVGGFFDNDDFILGVFLEAVHEKGLGRILAEPTLVARSGQPANFLVGGEVPIPVAQGGAFGSITVEFKPFGVAVEFTPTVLGPDRIYMRVSPEVSEPDFTIGLESESVVVPGFRTRQASTGVELADGQSFALAGLMRDELQELVNQYPLLGEIPVLGALFRSTEFQKRETELVIIATPHLVKPLGPGPHPLPGDHFVEPSALEFYLNGALEGRGEPKPRPGVSTSQPATPEGGLLGDAGHRIIISDTEGEN